MIYALFIFKSNLTFSSYSRILMIIKINFRNQLNQINFVNTKVISLPFLKHFVKGAFVEPSFFHFQTLMQPN